MTTRERQTVVLLRLPSSSLVQRVRARVSPARTTRPTNQPGLPFQGFAKFWFISEEMSSASSRTSTENQPESQPTSVRDEIQRLLKAGIMFFNDNQDGHALPMFKKAYMLSRSIPEPHLQAKCLFNLGATYITTGKPQKGLKCLWKAQEAGTGEKDGDLYFNIGAAYDNLKEYSKAAAYYRKAVHEYHVGQAASVADALIKMAYCLVSTGELGSAAHSFHQAGHMYRKLQLPEDAAMAMREAANYLLQSPKFSQKDVLEILQTCSQLCTEISNQELLSKLHNHVGLHYAEIRCFREAEIHFFKALELCTGKYFTVRKRAVLLQNLGAVYNAQEQFEKSLLYHSEAADMYGALGERTAQAQCLYNLATAHSHLKSHHTAEFYYRRALASFAEAGDTYCMAQAYEGIGATQLSLDYFDLATNSYKQALRLFEKSKEASEIPCKRIQAKLADIVHPLCSHHEGSADPGTDRRSQEGLH